jgi:hypothetical protein
MSDRKFCSAMDEKTVWQNTVSNVWIMIVWQNAMSHDCKLGEHAASWMQRVWHSTISHSCLLVSASAKPKKTGAKAHARHGGHTTCSSRSPQEMT